MNSSNFFEEGSNIKKEHLTINIEGFIQGVGMRPFIAYLAKEYRQNGWVANTSEGLSISLEGVPELQRQFLENLQTKLPPHAEIFTISVNRLPLANYPDFQIKTSQTTGNKSALILPDIATCQACIQDIFDPGSRFYRYPFTSCSHCGPRYSIMSGLPYDRGRTSMAEFNMCAACGQDYQDINNRRFHAQTIACQECGPTVSLLDHAGNFVAENDNALIAASRYLREGKIIAIKGIGGFQLIVDAANKEAIGRLRSRKHRPQKPFAMMVSCLSAAKELCQINNLEQQALTSCAAPIVLLKRRERDIAIADAVASDSGLLGIMLPCSPLHHLLMHEFGKPVVATSGNRQNETICVDNDQAITRLADIADYFLVHDRLILRPLDDSIVRRIGDKVTVLRRARGYTPAPIPLNSPLPDALAVGGHLKNTVAVSHDKHIILSQHIGDLDYETTRQQFENTITELQQFYQVKPLKLMHDLHEGYASSQYAGRQLSSFPQLVTIGKVQHHYAHILACMAEHDLEPPLLGVAWDGNGLGSDNTLWGGEFLLVNSTGFQRIAHLRTFPLPGGGKAMQEPRRAALGLLYEMNSGQCFDRKNLPFSTQEMNLLRHALTKQVHCPRTSSIGRWFDAIASLLDICQINQYEGQAAMLLENCAAKIDCDESYGFKITETDPMVIDWRITMEQLLADIEGGNINLCANKFHNTLSDIIMTVAEYIGEQNIVLSGGCFQNACLVTKAASKLKASGFNVYCHEKIPPNDGGLAVGQLYATKYMG